MKLNRILMFLALFLVLAACDNNSNPSENSDQNDNSVPDEIDYGLFCDDDCEDMLSLDASLDSIEGKVGFAVASTTFPYGAALKNGNEEVAEKYFPNMEFVTGDGKDDPSTQTKLIEDYISQDVDTIIINAVDENALVSAVDKATEAGIDVISVDRSVNTSVLIEIKAMDEDLGRNAGKFLIEKLEGEGNVVELQGSPSASPTIGRNKGFEEEVDKEEGIEIIASQNGDYDQAEGLSVMEDILQRFPSGEIDALFSHSDNMTLGAIQAIKAAGREDEITVVSIDGQEEAMEAVNTGDIDATVIYPVVSPMATIAAAKSLAGEDLPEKIELPAKVVTKDNVDEYLGTNF